MNWHGAINKYTHLQRTVVFYSVLHYACNMHPFFSESTYLGQYDWSDYGPEILEQMGSPVHLYNLEMEAYIWTSYTDNEIEGVFKNATGQVAEWTNWGMDLETGAQQPDGGHQENCVVVLSTDFSWHDVPCDQEYTGICIWLP